ncbi:MAG TPA: RHS repeat-associated core domain-containing protein [Phycisphaerae bacterium]|nr:RHS repeat-associated core domain-containing protein [Phycisphaerae bacterium]
MRSCVAAWLATAALAAEAQDTYFHGDDLYSAAALTDSAGAVTERREYADYGQPLDPASLNPGAWTASAPQGFTGRRYENETGLYHYRTRHLDPAAGRFTTRDTLGVWGDAAQAGNGTGYAAASPATRLDPFGREVRDRPLERWVYFDEWMRARANDVSDRRPDDLSEEQHALLLAFARPYKDFARNLAALRGVRGVAARDHYIDGRDEPAQFAQHAARNGNCTVSVYLGHGIMGDRAESVDEGSLGRVRDALGGALRGGDDRRPRPQFAFYSCYAGSYNQAVARDNRFSPGADWTGTTTGGGIADHFNDNFDGIRRAIEGLAKACGEGGVSLHMYWGSDSERPVRPRRD